MGNLPNKVKLLRNLLRKVNKKLNMLPTHAKDDIAMMLNRALRRLTFAEFRSFPHIYLFGIK